MPPAKWRGIMPLDGFGNRLKAVRKDRGYTQRKLADSLGVTEQAVSKWERGTSYPDISMLNGISGILDCSLDYLFQFEPDRNRRLMQDSIERKTEINRLLLPDIISLKFGEKLVPMFIEEDKKGFPHINNLRGQMASQWGVIIPTIRIMDELLLGPYEYQICIHGVPVYQDVQQDMSENGLIFILGKLKEHILKNIERILNNQMVYFMLENLREHYPYVTENIVPDRISYSLLRQVLIELIKDGYAVNSLVLILESIENHIDISDVKELASKVADDLGTGFAFENWVKM